MLGVNQPQVLIRVRQDIQNERGRIFQIQLWTLAQFHDFIHQLPRFLDGPPVDFKAGRRGRDTR